MQQPEISIHPLIGRLPYITLPSELVNIIFEKELPYFEAALLLHKSAILSRTAFQYFSLISAI